MRTKTDLIFGGFLSFVVGGPCALILAIALNFNGIAVELPMFVLFTILFTILFTLVFFIFGIRLDMFTDRSQKCPTCGKPMEMD